MKIGTAFRQLADRGGHKTGRCNDVTKADQLRSSTRDRLKEIALTEERVVHYAERMSQAVEAAHKTGEYTKGSPVESTRFLK